MEHEQIIALKSDEPMEIELLIELGEWLNQKNIKTHLIDRRSLAIQEAQKLLREEGARNILSLVELREAVLPKVPFDERPLLVQLLSTQLLNLSPHHSLIIIDPYFFSEANDVDGYVKIFMTIFSPIISQISKMTFITSAKYNKKLYSRVCNELSNINVHLITAHRITEDFHDRFWIVDEARGMFVGTSLNGIGKRYALTDYMREEDVKDVIVQLTKSSLL